MRMLESLGSFPYGNVAPAPVITTPASFVFATIAFAQPSMESKEIKYPPLGFVHCPMSKPLNSLSKVFNTASNFGRIKAACFIICSSMPSTSLKNLTWRSWLILSWPIVCVVIYFFTSSRLALEAANTDTPAPGKLTFDVEANSSTRSGLPAFSHSVIISNKESWSSSYRWCTQ